MPRLFLQRPKVFTDGRQRPIDRNDRARIMFLAQSARRRRQCTRSAIDVLRALLYTFANLADGRCIPSYARIAEAAGCDARTVGRCLPDLEAIGLISWVNRIRRVREYVVGIGSSWRVERTSNSYDFPAIARKTSLPAAKGHSGRGTIIRDSFSSSDPLEMALGRFEESFRGKAAMPVGGR